MYVVQFLRGVGVLLLGPILTIITSVASIVGAGVLGLSTTKVQAVPRLWARIMLKISGVVIVIKGGDNLSKEHPYIFAANHQSQFDIFALQGYLGFDFRWLAKKELFDVPVFGTALLKVGNIAVDRSHSRTAVKSLDEAAKRIAAGTSVVIFPEGTRSDDGNLLPFKSGAMVLAIKSRVPVVPMAIVGTHAILPKGKLMVKSGRVVLRIGEPIETSGYTLKQKHELAERLQDEVAALMEEEKANP